MKVSTKFHQIAACAVIVLLSYAPAMAQRGKWWQDDRFGRELGLTSEQRTRLEEIFQKTQPTLRLKMKALDEAQALFDRLVEKGDDTSVMNQVAVVEAARAEVSKARTMMLLRMRRSLTTDQWAKFTALHEASTGDRNNRQRTPDRPR
jgi:Spy/CpxP family protein refolding chaperone